MNTICVHSPTDSLKDYTETQKQKFEVNDNFPKLTKPVNLSKLLLLSRVCCPVFPQMSKCSELRKQFPLSWKMSPFALSHPQHTLLYSNSYWLRPSRRFISAFDLHCSTQTPAEIIPCRKIDLYVFFSCAARVGVF